MSLPEVCRIHNGSGPVPRRNPGRFQDPCGSQAGAQIFFNDTLTRTYNFGVTQTGAQAGLSVNAIDVNVKVGNAQSTVSPVIVRIYSGRGGTASLAFGNVRTGSATIVGGSAPSITTTGGVYDFANAVYTGTTFAFGYLHRGGAAVSGTAAIGNQTVTNDSYQDSLNVSAFTGNPLVAASGFTGLASSAGGMTRNNLTTWWCRSAPERPARSRARSPCRS